MAGDGKLQMPGSFGGLMRYDEDTKSKLPLSPGYIIGFVILILLFVIALKIFWPVVV